ASQFGWRGAFLASALLGFAVAALLLATGDVLAGRNAAPAKPKPQERSDRAAGGWRLLLSAPILINFAFFMLLSLANGGVQNYSVVALGALHGTPLDLANVGLSAYLLMSALGVLVGGYAVTRTERHDAIAVTMLAASSIAILPLAVFDLAPLLLVA